MENKIHVHCLTKDIESVESKLRDWNEVESLTSIREKRHKKDVTTIVVTCATSEATLEVQNRLLSIPELIGDIEAPSQNKAKKGKRQKRIDITAEILGAIPPEKDSASNLRPQRKQNQFERQHHQKGGRGRNGRIYDMQGRGRGRGGQSQYREAHSTARGGEFHTFQKIPNVDVSVAYIDNVPFGLSNARLMEILSSFGRVIDVNRFENMVMVCYETREAVVECIQALNGKKIEDNIVTVSSGTTRIPEDVLSSLSA